MNDDFVDHPFGKPVDLTDPVALVKKCEEQAESMIRESEAASGRGLRGGHPNPVHFYADCGAALRAAAVMIRDRCCSTVTVASANLNSITSPETPVTTTTVDASKGDAKGGKK